MREYCFLLTIILMLTAGLGPGSRHPGFPLGLDPVLTHRLEFKAFKPKHDSVIAYVSAHETFILDTLRLLKAKRIYHGVINGREDEWVQFAIPGRTEMDLYTTAVVAMRDLERADEILLDRRARNKRLASLTFTRVLPALMLVLFFSMYALRRLYVRVANVFGRMSRRWEPGCLALMFIVMFGVAWNTGSKTYLKGLSDAGQWVFEKFGLTSMMMGDPALVEVPAEKVMGLMLLIGLLAIIAGFILWLTTALAVAGLVSLVTSGRSARYVSHNGGATWTFHPEIPAAIDDYSGIVRFVLVYSYLVPAVYLVMAAIFPVSDNPARSLVATVVAVVTLSLLYVYLGRRYPKAKEIVQVAALSYLGFAVSIVLLLALAIVIAVVWGWVR